MTLERFDPRGEDLGQVELRHLYNSVNRQLNRSPFAEFSLFLNFGYVPNGNPRTSQHRVAAGELNRNPIQLVLELVGDLRLGPAHNVLDVGCGRGGTAWVLRRYFDVGRVAGLDLSSEAVAFCHYKHGDSRTRFMVANAERIPLPDRSLEVVTNIESSHGYPNADRFFREVCRVLRPGGWFLFTDLLPREQWEGLEHWLENLGLLPRYRQDISSNVLLSCDETASRNARAFAPGNDDDVLSHFLGMPQSAAYEGLKTGTLRYMLYRFALERR